MRCNLMNRTGRRGNGRKSREARDVSQKAPIPPPKLDCTLDAQIKCGMALGACVPGMLIEIYIDIHITIDLLFFLLA